MIVQAKLHIENIPEGFSPSLAYPLYAWLLSQVSAEAGNRLHEQGTRPVHQYLWLDPKTKKGWWTVNLLNNEAIELFMPVLEDKKEVWLHPCKFSFDSCEFERIEAPHVFIKRAQELTLDRRFPIELLTPASFKQSGRYVIFPQESLILQSLIVRWGLCFPDMPLDDADAFAAMLTGNPHAFDNGTADGNFLYQIIQMDMESRSIKIEASEIFPAYKRQKSYLMAGIMLDDISNYAMLYQVQAVKKDGSIHQGMAGFAREQHIVQVPLAVISEWELLRCSQDEIYIVENPSVFAVLCGKEKEKNTRRAYMCMNGQPRLAGLMVLELLAKSGTKVYYAGDLDPEGILIAQKLSRYYKGEFHYWHMETEDYEKCKSEEVISPKRMKILERITDDRLKPVVERIKAYGTAGYQEMLMEETK